MKIVVGSVLRYWMAFDLYEGNADAGGYHRIGAELAEMERGMPFLGTGPLPDRDASPVSAALLYLMPRGC